MIHSKALRKHPSRPVSRASQRVASPLSGIKTLTRPARARAWLSFSESELGRELARLTQRALPFDRRTVSGWEHGKPVFSEIIAAYGTLIANQLTRELGRTVGVKIAANSPWRITAWTRCECGRWFHLRRSTMRRCERCRA